MQQVRWNHQKVRDGRKEGWEGYSSKCKISFSNNITSCFMYLAWRQRVSRWPKNMTNKKGFKTSVGKVLKKIESRFLVTQGEGTPLHVLIRLCRPLCRIFHQSWHSLLCRHYLWVMLFCITIHFTIVSDADDCPRSWSWPQSMHHLCVLV